MGQSTRSATSFIVLSLISLILLAPTEVSAQTANMTVYIGPIHNEDDGAIANAKVYVSYGFDTKNATTGLNGTAKVIVPTTWTNKTVTVRVEKNDYKEKIFTGTIDQNGTFKATSGSIPALEEDQTSPPPDYSFIVVAFIVMIILLVVLAGMKPEAPKKHRTKNDKVSKGSEEE